MIDQALYSSRTEEWPTPQEFFDELDREFHFTLDPCATDENAKCPKYFTKEQDGLLQDWGNEVVFCNPPYGRKTMRLWARKCYESSLNGTTEVMLAPSRTDTRWFHESVYGKAELRFIKGRLNFVGGKSGAPFPSLLAIYKHEKATN